ncbi:unnamed protein product, partial [Discosporangium mesarthrocarpum]
RRSNGSSEKPVLLEAPAAVLKATWFTPKSVKVNAQRSKYGRRGWPAEYIFKQGKRVPSTDWDVVAAVSDKFARLTKGDKLPRHVWQAVAENVPAEADEEEQ